VTQCRNVTEKEKKIQEMLAHKNLYQIFLLRMT